MIDKIPGFVDSKGILVSILISIGLATQCLGQHVELSGVWGFKTQFSVSGNLYANGSPRKIIINQDTKHLEIMKTSTAGNGSDVITDDTIRLDGIPGQTKTSSNRKKVLSVTWSSDSLKLMETATVYNLADTTKVDFHISDTWSKRGNQLILDRKNENLTNGEVWESQAVYDKQ